MAALLKACKKSNTHMINSCAGLARGDFPAAGRSFQAIKSQEGFGLQLVASITIRNSRNQISRNSFERRAFSSSADPPNKDMPSIYQRVLNILRSVLIWIASFWKRLPQLEEEAEVAMTEVEKIAETVEKVATVAEKMSAEIAQVMPEESKLRDVAEFVEQVSKETAEGSHATENVLHKVEDIKKSMADIESMVDPLISKNTPDKDALDHP